MQISLKPSARLTVFFIAMYGCVTWSIWSSFAPWWLKILSTSICICSFIFVMRQYVWLSTSSAVVKVMLKPDERWELVRRSGLVEAVALQGDTIIAPFGIILNFKKERSNTSILICPDSVAGEQFRQLCVQLRTGRP